MIERICLNFQRHCNMKCPWCYIPFDIHDKYDPDETQRVVLRVRELGARVITFGGGDPYSYNGFPELVVFAKAQGLVTHVDTNAISLTKARLERCLSSIDLMAMPLDGRHTAHDLVRARIGHHETVLNRIGLFNDLRGGAARPALKINTIATRQNIGDIIHLGEIVKQVSAQRWSIYQYWPLINCATDIATYSLGDEEYLELLDQIRGTFPDVVVEGNLYDSRANTYLFVSHGGVLYTHDIMNKNSYMVLGSIFDDSGLARWAELARPTLRTAARERYVAALGVNQ